MQKIKSWDLNRYLYSPVHRSIIHTSQKVEATQKFIQGSMGKQNSNSEPEGCGGICSWRLAECRPNCPPLSLTGSEQCPSPCATELRHETGDAAVAYPASLNSLFSGRRKGETFISTLGGAWGCQRGKCVVLLCQ